MNEPKNCPLNDCAVFADDHGMGRIYISHSTNLRECPLAKTAFTPAEWDILTRASTVEEGILYPDFLKLMEDESHAIGLLDDKQSAFMVAAKKAWFILTVLFPSAPRSAQGGEGAKNG